MSIVVFVGPTMDAQTVKARLPGAVVRGPVAFGDVYRAARRRPRAIAIIDGYFDRVPAVWHKEILWAMSQGVHVFGASSMGALRAAELAEFGMEGVGEVFDGYRSGELEDEDEVAVAHRPSTEGFAPTSEALVNVRTTLRRAVEAHVVAPDTSAALLLLAKGRFYAERSYRALFRDAEAAALDAAELSALRDWLPNGHADQKRTDALTLLDHLEEWDSVACEAKRVSFHFHATDAWHEAVRVATADDEATGELGGEVTAGVLEELKVSGRYPSTRDASALRGFAIQEAHRAGVRPDATAVQSALDALRDALGLHTPADFRDWSARQGLSDSDALRLLEDEARCAWSRPLVAELARLHMADHLRSVGQYGELIAQACVKEKLIGEQSGRTPSLAELSISQSDLWNWYFRHRLGRDVPGNIDKYACDAGFRDTDDLRASAIRELMLFRSGRTERKM